MKNKKPFVREVILVEGKYDKNTLSQIVDAAIVTTDGGVGLLYVHSGSG